MVIVANGKKYDVHDNGYIYLDRKRVSKAQMMADLEEDIRPTPVKDTYENDMLERAEQNTIKTGNTMTYTDKVEAFGIEKSALERKVGKVAYKPMSEYNGKEYAGQYLANVNGKAKVISELTFKGALQVYDVNYKALGFFMPDLYNIAKTTTLSTFDSVRPGTLTLDDLGDVDEPEQLIDCIDVIRVQWADLDLVTFLNNTTGMFMGTKRYDIYKAEQEARLKRPDMDTIFDDLVKKDIEELEANLNGEKPKYDQYEPEYA